MATQPNTTTEQWFNETATAKVIAEINWRDFERVTVRGIPYDTLAYRPRNGVGFAVEEDLEGIRNAYVDAIVGFHPDEFTEEGPMREWLAVAAAQTSVQDVIDSAVTAAINLEFNKACVGEIISRAWSGARAA